jgi:hypothetical protein
MLGSDGTENINLRKERFAFALFAMLMLSVALLISISFRPASAEPGNDQGCYCHNKGIGVWFNGTDSLLFPPVGVDGGKSFVLNVTSRNIAATEIVPGIQQWMSNVTDNKKFTFNPQTVSANSTQNLSKVKGEIMAIYAITAPPQGGNYILTIFAQGVNLQIGVQVSGPPGTLSTSTSSISNSTTTTTTSSPGSQTSPSQTSSFSSTTSATTTTKVTRAVPDVIYYSSELALIVGGFSLFLVVTFWRYRKS